MPNLDFLIVIENVIKRMINRMQPELQKHIEKCDVIQETMLIILEIIGKIEQIKNEDEKIAFICGVAKNKIRDMSSKKWYHRHYSLESE